MHLHEDESSCPSIGGLWRYPSTRLPGEHEFIWIDEDVGRIISFVALEGAPVKYGAMPHWFRRKTATTLEATLGGGGGWRLHEFAFIGEDLEWKNTGGPVPWKRLPPTEYPSWMAAKLEVAYAKMDHAGEPDAVTGISIPKEEPSAELFRLSRFVEAQEGVYAQALDELRRGRKESHWMWFVFPQLAGLGSSAMAQRYAIGSLAEAAAYLRHPILKPRLVECCVAILAVSGKSAREIFGAPDDTKLRSSMTLFSQVPRAPVEIASVLDRYFRGEQDERTLTLLEESE